MIDFDETIRGIWFVQVEPGKQDYLAAVNELPNGKMQLKYRFRYYNSTRPWDDQDVCNWYCCTATCPLAEMIDKVQTVTNLLVLGCGAADRGQVYELIRNGRPLDEFMREFERQPFVHRKDEYANG